MTAGSHRHHLHRQLFCSAGSAAAGSATGGGSSSTPSISPLIARSMHSNLNNHHLENRQRCRPCGCTRAEDGHRRFSSTSIDSSSTRSSTGGLSSFSESSRSNSQGSIVDMEYDGVSEADAALINRHAKKVQTSVSLQALMRTGRGEFLHKTFDEESVAVDDHTATELVLMQVRRK